MTKTQKRRAWQKLDLEDRIQRSIDYRCEFWDGLTQNMLLGRGTYGFVYRATWHDHEDMIVAVKIVSLWEGRKGWCRKPRPLLPLKFQDSFGKENWEIFCHEINIWQLLNTHNIGPRLQGYRQCPQLGLGMIISECFDYDLNCGVRKHNFTINPRCWLDLQGEMERLHAIFPEDPLIHRDILPKNILVRLDPSGQEIVAMTLIDFSFTSPRSLLLKEPDDLVTFYNYYHDHPYLEKALDSHGLKAEQFQAEPLLSDTFLLANLESFARQEQEKFAKRKKASAASVSTSASASIATSTCTSACTSTSASTATSVS